MLVGIIDDSVEATGTPVTLRKKATIHQVITMLATSKNVLFPGHDHLLTTSNDVPTL